MHWWRLKQFLKLWWLSYASGESKWGKVRKVLGLLIFVGALPVAVSNYVFLIYLQDQSPDTSPAFLTRLNLGLLLAAILAAAWALISAGRAYELTGVPDLKVGNELISDEVTKGHYFFRLELISEDEDFDTTARLIEILDSNLNPVLHGRFPIELEWSHHPEEIKIHLEAGIRNTISVALMRRRGIGDYELRYTGAKHQGRIDLNIGEKVYFHVQIKHRKSRPINRWFWFEKTSNASFSYESCARPQAIPAMSKRAE